MNYLYDEDHRSIHPFPPESHSYHYDYRVFHFPAHTVVLRLFPYHQYHHHQQEKPTLLHHHWYQIQGRWRHRDFSSFSQPHDHHPMVLFLFSFLTGCFSGFKLSASLFWVHGPIDSMPGCFSNFCSLWVHFDGWLWFLCLLHCEVFATSCSPTSSRDVDSFPVTFPSCQTSIESLLVIFLSFFFFVLFFKPTDRCATVFNFRFVFFAGFLSKLDFRFPSSSVVLPFLDNLLPWYLVLSFGKTMSSSSSVYSETNSISSSSIFILFNSFSNNNTYYQFQVMISSVQPRTSINWKFGKEQWLFQLLFLRLTLRSNISLHFSEQSRLFPKSLQWKMNQKKLNQPVTFINLQ